MCLFVVTSQVFLVSYHMCTYRVRICGLLIRLLNSGENCFLVVCCQNHFLVLNTSKVSNLAKVKEKVCEMMLLGMG